MGAIMTLDRVARAEQFGGKGDDFYQALLAAHAGLDDFQSAALNARLVLLLANHIGNLTVLQEALALARASIDQGPTESGNRARAR
jgi:Protein of unknown function (DUF2783)